MDEKSVEDKTSKIESNNRGKADAHDKSKVRITTQPVVAAPSEVIDNNYILTKVPPDTLGLLIVNSGDLVLIEQAKEVTLGRNVEGAETPVSLDLTPYRGGPLGVSRLHAAILISKNTYLLQDLGSTNGTWLNQDRLPSRVSRILKSGDLIRLGQLRIHVAFHGSEPDQDSGDPGAVE